jgi:hypothetical protein
MLKEIFLTRSSRRRAYPDGTITNESCRRHYPSFYL